jgi:acyl transferase domain-containing protein
MQTALNSIREVAKKTKVTTPDAPMYSNTSLETVKAQEVYREALTWLSQMRQRYDPKDVMSLTGGFKIPLN